MIERLVIALCMLLIPSVASAQAAAKREVHFGVVIDGPSPRIDHINIEIDENGLSPARAIVVAGQRRLRPIFLTTFTTILGLVPLWLGGGPMWQPMAIAIIFGLMFSTALTLVLVPVLYRFRVSFSEFHDDAPAGTQT